VENVTLMIGGWGGTGFSKCIYEQTYTLRIKCYLEPSAVPIGEHLEKHFFCFEDEPTRVLPGTKKGSPMGKAE
jgi:hypothetical protein